MKHGTVTITYTEHASVEPLSAADQQLVRDAHDAALLAYAPYSRFKVGAALRMADGRTVTGNNQENASFPAGICAERTALHAAMSTQVDGRVEVMAIIVPSAKGERPVAPCGICRQALLEQEFRQGGAMRLLMAVAGGAVVELASAKDLLPFSFDATFLNP